MVGLDPPGIKTTPIEDAVSKMKLVPLNCDTIMTARALGISFGD
jgi:ATP-dependent phosphofructokinase / diphosphate-dependent phosphofructokinase